MASRTLRKEWERKKAAKADVAPVVEETPEVEVPAEVVETETETEAE